MKKLSVLAATVAIALTSTQASALFHGNNGVSALGTTSDTTVSTDTTQTETRTRGNGRNKDKSNRGRGNGRNR